MPTIKGVIETSFIDWPGRMCAVLFLGGCNFRCPFCHNHPLVLAPHAIESQNVDEVLARLAPYRQWLDAICISGGEPTLDTNLPALIKTIKARGFAVKLDTNGTRPDVLAELIEDKLLDMVSMDVKAPLEERRYNRSAGVRVDLASIRKSINLIKESGVGHEFRMTVVPHFHSRDDIVLWREQLAGSSRLTLQNFNSRTTLDPELCGKAGFAPDIFEQFKSLV